MPIAVAASGEIPMDDVFASLDAAPPIVGWNCRTYRSIGRQSQSNPSDSPKVRRAKSSPMICFKKKTLHKVQISSLLAHSALPFAP